MFDRMGQNTIVWLDKTGFLMFEKIGTKFKSWKGEDQNSNTYKNRARIPMFDRMGQNTIVWLDKTGFLMFEKIGTKFESWKGEDQNSNTYRKRARIPMFERMGLECQRLNG